MRLIRTETGCTLSDWASRKDRIASLPEHGLPYFIRVELVISALQWVGSVAQYTFQGFAGPCKPYQAPFERSGRRQAWRYLRYDCYSRDVVVRKWEDRGKLPRSGVAGEAQSVQVSFFQRRFEGL